MRLNDLHPGAGARRSRRRRGRGIGSGRGKTCGHGHKGQNSRSGGRVRPGFEGGQMPLQRRVPKLGFRSPRAALRAALRLDALARVPGDGVIDLAALQAAGLVNARVRRVKLIASGTLRSARVVRGLAVSSGARQAIEAAGGRVEEGS